MSREDQNLDTATDLFTIKDFVRYGLSQFRAHQLHFGHGTDNAFDEAAWLVLHALALPFDFPHEFWDCRLTPAERAQVTTILRERILTRKPAAYLTHEAWFMGLPFHIDERVLVPRSPLAELIANRFEPWTTPETITRVLDMGTGSGCIGIAAATVLPEAEIWLVDLSDDALAVARHNVERHHLADRIQCVRSDVFAALEPETHFDLIIANPPYVDAEDMASLPMEYRHEPELGLAAGEDGLDVVRRILAGAANHLNPGGLLICEVGNSQPALEAAYPELPFTWLEFTAGGHGVFLLTREQLAAN